MCILNVLQEGKQQGEVWSYILMLKKHSKLAGRIYNAIKIIHNAKEIIETLGYVYWYWY